MKNIIEQKIKEVLKNLGINEEVNFSIEHPDNFKNGDYSTNVAMVCSKKLNTNPKDLALKIKQELEKNIPKEIEKIEVAGPGFINFYLSREFFIETIKEVLEKGDNWGKNEILLGKKVMVEYTQPNPFKPFHIGHLMSNAIGESVSRIVEYSGSKIIRVNYQGDVGPHVAKAIYGLINFGMPDESKSISEKAEYIGECYSKGSNLYDTNIDIKNQIDEINKKIYDKSDEKINEIYFWGREITLLAFEEIYKVLGTKFDYYFFESDMAIIGEKIVRENIGEVFNESNGAIVFHGENFDSKLHTRVFINSQGLPTYETKEVGLTVTKFERENPDVSIVTTAIEQAEYMKVVSKAISIMYSDFESRMRHITHGMMRLQTGKMSSRKGNVVTGESLLKDSMNIVFEKIKDRNFDEDFKKQISKVVGVSALKYSILKSSLGSDIVYDFEKSISFEGDSGPYLQYGSVRAKSIIEKSKGFNLNDKKEIPNEVFDIEKELYKFPEVVIKSYNELALHHIVLYLTSLTSKFNSFYNQNQILKDENIYMKYEIDIVKSFYQTMKNGLWILGIEIPEKM